jgi:hypothetical protein
MSFLKKILYPYFQLYFFKKNVHNYLFIRCVHYLGPSGNKSNEITGLVIITSLLRNPLCILYPWADSPDSSNRSGFPSIFQSFEALLLRSIVVQVVDLCWSLWYGVSQPARAHFEFASSVRNLVKSRIFKRIPRRSWFWISLTHFFPLDFRCFVLARSSSGSGSAFSCVGSEEEGSRRFGENSHNTIS